jgi:ATP-binding protein involved in chromosome partitioning
MFEKNLKEIIKQTLKKIEHPEIAKTLFELGMIKDIKFEDRKVSLNLMLPLKEISIKELLIEDIKRTLKEKIPDITVEINLKKMDQEERLKFIKMAQEAWRGAWRV